MTQVPLRILITDSKLVENIDISPQLEKLRKAGHDIVVDDSLRHFDFITGPNCWLLRPEVAGLFSIAVTNARKIANADQKRVEQITAAKAGKRTAKSASGTRKRSNKVKGVVKPEGPNEAGPVTNLEADSGGM